MKNKVLWLWLLVAALTIETIVLSMVNRNLRKKLNTCKFILYTPDIAVEQNRLPIVPNLDITDVANGNVDKLFNRFERDQVLLFLFSTDCHNCDTISETWNDIFDQYGDTYAIIGICQQSIPAIKDYILRNDIRFPVVQSKQLSDFGFFSYPQTILANNQGQIKTTIKGASDKLNQQINLEEEKK